MYTWRSKWVRLPMLFPWNLCRPVGDGSINQRRKSESIHESKFVLAVAFVNLGLYHYPHFWFINPVAGQGEG